MANNNLHASLDKNPYGYIFIPVISALQGENVNPHEKLMAGFVIAEAARSWGTGLPINISENISAVTPGVEPQRCPNCIVAGALAERAADPYTALIKNFVHKLNAMDKNVVNSWIWFNQCVDAFYQSVHFVTYFTGIYREGRDAAFYLSSIGAGYREGSYGDGLKINKEAEGSVGQVAAFNRVITDTVSISDAGTYFFMYSSPTTREIFHITVDGGDGGWVSLPPVQGVTDSEYAVPLLSVSVPQQNAVTLRDTILLTAVPFGSVSIVNETRVEIYNFGVGSVPASEFNLPTGETNWGGLFVDGSSGAADIEATSFDFNYAIASNLDSRGFVMYDDANQSYLFYYDANIGGSAPDPGFVPDITEKIIISLTDNKKRIQDKTEAAINAFARWNLVSSVNLVSVYENLAQTPVNDTLPLNAVIGNGTDTVTDIKGYDDSVLYSGAVNDKLFQDKWNELKVTYDAAAGVNTPFLKSVDDPDYCTVCACCDTEGVFLQTTYAAVTDNLNFNVPAQSFSAVEFNDHKACKDCLW